jgi:hypothetical protein
LPEPRETLEAWHEAAPSGRVVLLESIWGAAERPEEKLRSAAREVLKRLRKVPPDHHGQYGPEIFFELPLGSGASPEMLVSLDERGFRVSGRPSCGRAPSVCCDCRPVAALAIPGASRVITLGAGMDTWSVGMAPR